MRVIKASTISQPIVVNGESLVIEGPENGRLIIKADVQVTNGELMIRGHDVIIESCQIKTQHGAGEAVSSDIRIETNGNFFVLGAGIQGVDNTRIYSQQNLDMMPSYFARVMNEIKQGAIHLNHYEPSAEGAAAAASSGTAHDDDVAVSDLSGVTPTPADLG